MYTYRKSLASPDKVSVLLADMAALFTLQLPLYKATEAVQDLLE